MLTVIERMDDEFTKMLQNCDAHSTEYVHRYVIIKMDIPSIQVMGICLTVNFTLMSFGRVILGEKNGVWFVAD